MATLKSDEVNISTFYNDKRPNSSRRCNNIKCACIYSQRFKIHEAQASKTENDPVCRNPKKSTKSH